MLCSLVASLIYTNRRDTLLFEASIRHSVAMSSIRRVLRTLLLYKHSIYDAMLIRIVVYTTILYR